MPPRKTPKKPAKPSASPRGRASLEEELRHSEARLRSVLDNVPDLVLELDRQGVVRYANRARPGFESEDLAGTDVVGLVLPRERDGVRAALARAWESGRAVDLEFAAPDPQGHVTWWWARVAPQVRDGATERLLVAAHEVTKRKLAEQQQRSAEHRLQDLLDPLNLLAVVVRGDGRIAYCNDCFLVRTGWRRDELIGQPFLERCVPPDTRPIVAPILARAVHTASVPAHYEHAITTRDGARRLIAWSHTVLQGAEGRFAALASLGEDITDRRVTEAALRESEEKFRALFSASVDAIGLYDVETARVSTHLPSIMPLRSRRCSIG